MADHQRGVPMLFSAVQVLPGEGTVVRTGDVVLWWEPGPTMGADLPERLVQLARDLAAEGSSGATGAGTRLAELLRTGDAQALSGLVLVLPSATALRAVVLGAGQVLAPGVDIPRGWVDTEIAWPTSMAVGRADGRLQPPVAGSPYDLVEGATPGSGAAIVLVARSIPAYAEEPVAAEPASTTTTTTTIVTSAAEPLPALDEPDLPPPAPATPPPAPVAVEAGLPPVDAPAPVALPVDQPAWSPVHEVPPPPPEPLPTQAVAAEPAPARVDDPPTVAWSPTSPVPPPPPPMEAPTVAMPGPPRFTPEATPAPPPAPPAPPAPTPAELYGAIVVDDGGSFALDGDYAIGSNPTIAPEIGSGALRPLPLGDTTGQVHPVHAEVRHGDGGTLLLIARAQTFLLPEGAQAWQDAPPHHPIPLQPGVTIAIGQRTLRLAAPTRTP